MKRWAIRLLALGAIGTAGWLTVALAQRQWETTDVPTPDFSKPPVNADAVAGVAPTSATKSDVVQAAATQSQDRPPADPFQGFDRTATSGAAAPTTVAAEPARLNAPANATPIQQTAGTITPRHALPDSIPSASDAGIATAAATAPAKQTAAAPADPFATSQTDQKSAAAPGNRYAQNSSTEVAGDRYSNSGIIPAAGIAAATGAITAAGTLDTQNANASDNTGKPATQSASASSPLVGSRYQKQTAPADSIPPADYRQQTAPAESVPNDEMNSRLLPPHSSAAGTPPAASSLPVSAAGQEDNLLRPSATSPNDSASALVARSMPAAGAAIYDGAASTTNVEGTGKPGDKHLEGAQSPSVTIEKTAPPEIQVGKSAKFDISVRNVGTVDAADVEVTDAVPQGTQLVNTTPKASVSPRGEIIWKLGTLKPADQAKLELEVMPIAEGEIGSVASVQFRSVASVRTIATKPQLVLEVNAQKQVMIGTDLSLSLKLSNPGTGAADKVVLQEKVPAGLQHPSGSELELDVGQLKPGETRQMELTLHAVQAGKFTNTLVVQGDANLHTEQSTAIEVIAPALGVGFTGPGMRYLDRQAKYSVSVTNPGTAPAKDVELITHLPQGMQFVEASDSGHYDAPSNSVIWSLAELPPGQTGNVSLTTLAKEAGEQKFRTEGHASGGLSDTNEQVTSVEGVAAVLFTVADVEDPVEVGSQATYEIHVVNQGSKAATRIQVGALLPPELKPVSADGPAKFTVDGQRVVFEPLARLAPKADITYKVVGQCLAPGDLRVKVQLQTDDMAQPVTKEESTRVYKD